MNISNYLNFIPLSSLRNYTTKTYNSNWSLAKAAALLTGIFLGYAVSRKFEDDPEIKAYKKTHPNAPRSYMGFGPFKKASTTGPFYHCTQEKNLIEIFEHNAVKICCHGLLIPKIAGRAIRVELD